MAWRAARRRGPAGRRARAPTCCDRRMRIGIGEQRCALRCIGGCRERGQRPCEVRKSSSSFSLVSDWVRVIRLKACSQSRNADGLEKLNGAEPRAFQRAACGGNRGALRLAAEGRGGARRLGKRRQPADQQSNGSSAGRCSNDREAVWCSPNSAAFPHGSRPASANCPGRWRWRSGATKDTAGDFGGAGVCLALAGAAARPLLSTHPDICCASTPRPSLPTRPSDVDMAIRLGDGHGRACGPSSCFRSGSFRSARRRSARG